jgi:hypothetical protein
MPGVVSAGGARQTGHQFLVAALPEMSDLTAAFLKGL